MNKFLNNKITMNKIIFKALTVAALTLPLFAMKTKSLVLEGDLWNKGQYQQAFINQELNLQLTPQIEKIVSEPGAMIWDVMSDNDKTWVTTGSEGKVFSFDKDNKKSLFRLDDKEITTVIRAKDYIYLGSGPEGKIYRIPVNQAEGDVGAWVETGEQFIWDLKFHDGELWAASGGERGKIFRITDTGELIPTITIAEPNILKLDFQKKQEEDYLYFSASTAGKLYRAKVSEIKSGNGKLRVLFDAGEKDIPDFVFAEGSVYLITSGSGPVIGSSPTTPVSIDGDGEINPQISGDGVNGIDGINLTGKNNYLVKIGPNQDMEFIYNFENKNPARLAVMAITAVASGESPRLYVGILEKAEIYRIMLNKTALPGVSKIFSHSSANLSALTVDEAGQLNFSLAHLGEVYRLGDSIAAKGDYMSEVFDFKETVNWGQVAVENHNPNTEVNILTRSGNSSTLPLEEGNISNLTPVTDWSSWETAGQGIQNPPARFLQVKIELIADKTRKQDFSTESFLSPSPLLKKLTIFYGKKNSPHRITSFKLFKHDLNPNIVGGPQSPNPQGQFDVYSADHTINTIFSTEDKTLIPAIDPNSSKLPFPMIGKKEYILKWEGQNLDQDVLVCNVYYRNLSSATPSQWRLLRGNFLGNMLLIDGYKFIDGVYQFKLTVSDSLQNEKSETFTSEAVTAQEVFDNQPPQVEDLSWEGDTVRFRVKDGLSLIDSVKYTVDHLTISLLSPEDGIYDEASEEFRFTPESGDLIIIVKDSSDNIFYHSVKPKR